MSTLPSRSLPTRSYPATMSTLPSRSLATELSPSYFSVPRLGPTVFQDNSIDGNCPEKPAPPALHFCIAPSQPRPPPSYFHASQSMHARPALPPAELPPKLFPCFTLHPPRLAPFSAALPSRSLQRGLPQAISTLRSPSMRSQLPSSSGAPPKLFHSRFTVHPRWSGAPVSLSPAEIPRSYFQAISTLSTPSALVPPFLPFFLPSCLPSFPLSFLSSFLFLPSFVPSLLVRLFCLAPLAAKEAKREPKHRRCVREKAIKKQCFAHFAPIKSHPWCCSSSAIYTHWVTIRQRITTNRREGAWMLC